MEEVVVALVAVALEGPADHSVLEGDDIAVLLARPAAEVLALSRRERIGKHVVSATIVSVVSCVSCVCHACALVLVGRVLGAVVKGLYRVGAALDFVRHELQFIQTQFQLRGAPGGDQRAGLQRTASQRHTPQVLSTFQFIQAVMRFLSVTCRL